MRWKARLIGIALAVLLCGGMVCPTAFAGPPFQTDDPEPVPYHHWEVYTFAARDKTYDTDSLQGPGLEINNGIAPNTQLHLIIPNTFLWQSGGDAQGLGDIEAGVKYRFVDQTKHGPEIGTFPQIELPSGDSSRGLGNGRAWYKLPIWLQKDAGPWTTYGGAGYAINDAPGQRDYCFGGWLVQRTLSPHLTLGGELFFQGATTTDGRSTTLWNIGGLYNFTPDFSLLFSAGHSLTGDGHSLLYVGIYRTFGPGAP